MTYEKKKALKTLISSLALVILLVGIFTDVYEISTGLIIAIAMWILARPALRFIGTDVPQKNAFGMVNKEAEEQRSKNYTCGTMCHFFTTFLWISLVVVILAFMFGYISSDDIRIGRGSGVVVTQTRDVADFNRIELSGIGNLIISQAGEESLKIEAEDNLINKIETKVVDDTLEIKIVNKWFVWSFWPTKDINYYISVDDLEKISVSGSSNIQIKKLTVENLDIRISGSGGGNMNLDVGNLIFHISGSSKFTLLGRADEEQINISGSGKFDTKDLVARKVVINISGSGNIITTATDELNVSISGSGKVEYLGFPTITQNVSGSGSIQAYEEIIK